MPQEETARGVNEVCPSLETQRANGLCGASLCLACLSLCVRLAGTSARECSWPLCLGCPRAVQAREQDSLLGGNGGVWTASFARVRVKGG